MVSEGLRPKDISKRFGLSPSQVSIIINSPLFQAELARLEGEAEIQAVDVAKELRMLQPRALEILAEDLYNPNGDRKHKSHMALEVLDRTGYGKTTAPQEHRHLHLHAHQEVEKMDTREIYKEVIEMVEEG